MTPQLFAVERYDESGGARPVEALPELPPGTRLACAVHLPADDTVLALVEGSDEESVRAELTRAGWRVDRISACSWVTPPAALLSASAEPA
ncbi:hypothetical protein [Jatrophihabitans sp.]|uniref:hypothetical protein n=1 Tax=Jatrophihabitans sp. TaxID=1932789 RepID=UPI0030C6D29C|nr:hypothetical protein [Jatrophihabitans sp.]